MTRLDARERAVMAALDRVRARADLRARRADDPVELAHRFTDPSDQELAALVASSCAFGNVKAIRAKLDELFARIGPEGPARAADRPRALKARLAGWKHRVFRGEDLAQLLIGARGVQREAGSLGAAFVEELAAADAQARAPEKGGGRRVRAGHLADTAKADTAEATRAALAAFCTRIRRAGGLPVREAPTSSAGGRRASTKPTKSAKASTSTAASRRGPAHLLPDVLGGSGAKRLLLFLRWMVRPSDGIDLGLWDVSAARLLVPVDVHIHKLARNLGLTSRRDLSWRTTVEITRALARFDANDPVGYDFSLCHMGMLQRCPSRRDAARCEGCGVKPVCVHWSQARTTRRSHAPLAHFPASPASETGGPRAKAGNKDVTSGDDS